MALSDVARELVAGCREGRERENLHKLYAVDALSVEPSAPPVRGRETRGLREIERKHDWWEKTFEVHDLKVEGPFLHGDDRFAVIFEMDAENRETRERSRMREVAIYHVANDRIVREEFFYGE